MSWRRALGLATAVFVATPNDRRLLDAVPRAKLGVPHHQLAITCQDLERVRAEPLPRLDGGFVFLGALGPDGDASAMAAAAAAFGDRNAGTSFMLAVADGASAMTSDAPEGRLQAVALDGNFGPAIRE